MRERGEREGGIERDASAPVVVVAAAVVAAAVVAADVAVAAS